MNIIQVDGIKLAKNAAMFNYTNSKDILMKFTNLDWLTFDNYLVEAVCDKQHENFNTAFFFEILSKDELPILMEDLEPNAKLIIHYFDFFKEQLELYIAPQIVIRENEPVLDLYAEPADNCKDYFLSLPDCLQRVATAIFVLNYVEQKLQKNKQILKRKMPTPEQKETIHSANKGYKSNPIVLKDISVQYVYEPHEQKKYKRHCEAWGVRGHYRHLKNGKTIFIKPFIKGKGKIKNTHYIIKD